MPKKFTKNFLASEVLKYLAENKLMSLATSSKNGGPWASTLFFAFDKNLNILFFSRPDTRHCKNILKNPRVALTINQNWGGLGSIKGLQISGVARRPMKNEYKKYYAIYKKRYSWADKFPDHAIYVIEPTEVHFINQEIFGHFFRVKI
ncbi:MAG: hypothetical protein A2931_02010 [Candidatus Niyogibacteria bacterium RIFCSPLOWO2_01_FULL_45_48]|uniref:Pyridoxamine 5'-phosphate oxidase N-terminal domain-containing protein n=2 Tax=Candidatus Niyogiibacteriota TaxID=1817912 RepID=A0A1G2EZM0_9BACT|nr:MAG: hypothetical protein A2835_02615 [Candidatus Niyogibacteria bacterium RIFCSPHIGHO2_01_FULL_45_28]OGZ30670.1 MAG: hypothetical protein A2931_02010 [Candidatus Niyogibacteria bacterium RIFCSPLOWO2_01_FULL_45_48]OGZ31249.1 MAG: hypothetical protein A3J00_01750 [Candidatus Niyogibacteria bacterium RIFCSPLOWO2_02_FULL_45_13]